MATDGCTLSSSFPSSRVHSRRARCHRTNEGWCLINLAQTPDSPLNIEEQTSAVVPIHLERALPLHRLGEARRQENVSRRNVARHLGITVEDVRQQECPTTDLPLSVLHKWAKVLGRPVAELVANRTIRWQRRSTSREPGSGDEDRGGHPGANPRSADEAVGETMVDQLIEIMPELRGINAWHAVGKRRRLNELSITAERRLSDDIFMDVAD